MDGIFLIFLPENRIQHFIQIVCIELETIYKKYQILFSGKSKKNTVHLSSAENFTHSAKC